MAEQRQNTVDWTPIILLGGGFLAYKIFGESPEDKKGGEAVNKLEALALEDNPFEFQTYKLPKKEGYMRFTLTGTQALEAAKTIKNGFGIISDDESEIVGGVKKAKTKADIALISGAYSRFFKRDLYTDMVKNLSRKKELGGLIANYVLKLPKYLKGKTN